MFALHKILFKEKLRNTLFIHTMDYDTEFVELCSSNIRRISIIMYSLFCESLNKVQMKLIKLQSHTDFTDRFV